MASKSKTSDLPEAGNVFAFRTSPYSEFAPPETGRFAAFKVLGANANMIAVAILAGTWPAPPALQEVGQAPTLREHRFWYDGKPAHFSITAELWAPSDLEAFTYLGDVEISREDRETAQRILTPSVGFAYSMMRRMTLSAEGEWRWQHDHDVFVKEQEQLTARADAIRTAQEERYRTRLKTLTWEQLLSETQFDNWTPSPPYPPEDFTTAARQQIHDACRALQALGSKPRKGDVRAILKACVEWFNAADDEAGGVIETEERENICSVLEELAYVARQKSLFEEMDSWRDW